MKARGVGAFPWGRESPLQNLAHTRNPNDDEISTGMVSTLPCGVTDKRAHGEAPLPGLRSRNIVSERWKTPPRLRRFLLNASRLKLDSDVAFADRGIEEERVRLGGDGLAGDALAVRQLWLHPAVLLGMREAREPLDRVFAFRA